MYASIAQNLTSTGVDRLIFRVSGPGPGFSVIHYDQDATILQNLNSRKGWAGSLAGERVSDTLLQDLARHPANPFKLADNLNYVVSNYDHNLVEYGTIDGVRPVWDQLIAPHLKDYGISTDPGVVPRTPGAPDGGVLEQPTPIGTAVDPAMKLVFELQGALRKIAAYQTTGESIDDPLPTRRMDETPLWRHEIAPLLANPLMSS